MHTSKRKTSSSNKKRLAAIIVIVVILLVGVAFALVRNYRNTTTIKQSPVVSAKNQIDYTPAQPSDNTVNENRKNNPSSTGSTATNNPTSSTAPSSLDVTITRVNSDSQNKQVLIGTLVSGTTVGTCLATLEQGGQTDVTATNNVELQNNAYVCPNFIIPFSRFPSSGKWSLSVTLTNSSSKTTNWTDPVVVP